MGKIIIADDSTTARMIVKKCLEIIGFDKNNFNKFVSCRYTIQAFMKSDTYIMTNSERKKKKKG